MPLRIGIALLTFAAFVSLAAAATAAAADPTPRDRDTRTPETRPAQDEVGHGPALPHHLAVFGGATIHHGHAAPTFGVEYEFRLPVWQYRLGVGPIVEGIFDTSTASIIAPAAFLHPWGGLKLLAAPGVEATSGHAAFLVRGGLGYEFHLGSWSLTPLAQFDWVFGGGLAQVYGLSVGYGF